jgi:hypothetical protein
MRGTAMAAGLLLLAVGAAAQQTQAPKAQTGNAMTLGVMQDRNARTTGERLYVEKCAIARWAWAR